MGIRQASAKDIALIQKIAYETWPVAYGKILSPAQIDYMLQRFYSNDALLKAMAMNQQFLLSENPEAIGFASFQCNAEPGRTKLHKLYVLPSKQSLGCGNELLNAVIDAVKSAANRTVYLNVNRFNNARFFYEKAGYTITNEVDIPIGQGYLMEDFVMERNI